MAPQQLDAVQPVAAVRRRDRPAQSARLPQRVPREVRPDRIRVRVIGMHSQRRSDHNHQEDGS